MQYLGQAEEAVIPDACTSIGTRAFKDQTQLRRVVVPKSVKKTCEKSFGDCTALEQVELTEGLEEVESGALLRAPRDARGVFEIPAGVKSVADYAFWCRRAAFCDPIKRFNRFIENLYKMSIPFSFKKKYEAVP